MAGRIIASSVPRLLPPLASPQPSACYGGLWWLGRGGGLGAPLNLIPSKPLHTSQTSRLKEIVVEEEGGGSMMTVEGRYLPSPITDRVVRCGEGEGEDKACPLCSLNLDVKHTDVLILSQFMTPDGGVLPSRTTGLCGKQQRRITWLVIMAQKAGLMPNLTPAKSKKDPHRRYGSKKFNRYFDEDTLPKK